MFIKKIIIITFLFVLISCSESSNKKKVLYHTGVQQEVRKTSTISISSGSIQAISGSFVHPIQ